MTRRTNEKNSIFGHSLSIFEFLYFQSIFDYYSIYDSVYNLFENYGERLDNKDRGKNLLHKFIT